jgi:glucokinase
MKLKKVVLLNDFEAVGYSMLSDKISDNSYIINSEYFENNKVVKNKSISVFGPGTGLGTCMLNYDKG